MNNKEYIAELSRRTGYSQDDTQRMVRCVVEGMSQKFDEGIGVSIASFGVFEIKKRMERIVVNPSSGQRMLVPPKIVVDFRAQSLPDISVGQSDEALDVADVLSQKYGIDMDMGGKFANAMLGVVKDELAYNPNATVKIKGLGTFRMAATGGRGKAAARTLAAGGSADEGRMAFLPEVVLRDRVNRPFLQFETVVINDGVDFGNVDEELENADDNSENADSDFELENANDMFHGDDADDETFAGGSSDGEEKGGDESHETDAGVQIRQEDTLAGQCSALPEKEPQHEEALTEHTAVKTDTDISGSDVSDGGIACEGTGTASGDGIEDPREDRGSSADAVADDMRDDTEKQKIVVLPPVCKQRNPRTVYWLSLLSFVMLATIGVALYVLYVRIEEKSVAIEKIERHIAAKSVRTSTGSVRVAVSPNAVRTVPDSTCKVSSAEGGGAKKSAAVSDSTKVDDGRDAAAVETAPPDYNYDARVRTGAYIIVGTEKIVEVRAGQTLEGISRTYLGKGMECYVEVYNKRTEVRPGDRLKIPKLKLKRKK